VTQGPARDLVLVLLGLAAMVGGGAAALGLARWPRAAGVVAALGVVLGAGLGLVAAVDVLRSGAVPTAQVSWGVPGGVLSVGLDPLSALFLVPTLLLGAAAAVYGVPYLLTSAATRNVSLAFFGFNLLVACLALVLLARDAVLFLLSWETMAFTTALLVAWDHQHQAARRAGWVYFVAAHMGAAALFLLFLLLKAEAGSFGFAAFAARPPASGGAVAVVLLLALLGFGSKAGLVPFHVWLPEAHAAAPSHVSAVLSAVLVKVGLYGLLRIGLLIGPAPDWWGPLLVALGLGSALVAVALAISQRDLKRVLAYSTVENVGLIVLALGVASWASGRGLTRVASLALAGAVLHLWNHVLMKGSMFLLAGNLLHGTGTRDLEQLGGLARRMPFTAALLTLGAVALSALPPLNGFVSEWLMYLGLMRLGSEGGGSLVALLVVGGVALVGALAALCFARLFGVALLGQPRSRPAAKAHESSPWMLGPIFALALASVGVALAPVQVLGALALARAQVLGAALAPLTAADEASLGTLGTFNLALWGLLLAGALGYRALLRRRPAAVADTWGCGYAAPTPRMQYGARSFSELASEHMLPRLLRARLTRTPPAGLFPGRSSLEGDDTDPATRGIYEPAFARFAGRMSTFAWVQRGQLNSYLSYVLLALVAALLWVTLGSWVGL
jgi:hydrogenase-4 component B